MGNLDQRVQRVILVPLGPREIVASKVIQVRTVVQARCVAPQVSLGLRATRVIVASQVPSVCKALVVLRDRMVRMASLDLLDLLDQRETKAQLVLVAPLATLALAVRRATRATLALLASLAPLVTVAPRVLWVMSVPTVRQASADLLAPRVTLEPSVQLAAWV